jgi:hypothetical protein
LNSEVIEIGIMRCISRMLKKVRDSGDYWIFYGGTATEVDNSLKVGISQ